MNAKQYQQRFFLEEEQQQLIFQMAASILPELTWVIDQFYIWMRDLPEFKQFFHNEAHVARVKAQQTVHWTSFWTGAIDEKYVAERKRIGETHARISLPLETYHSSVSVFNHLYQQVFEKLSITDAKFIHAYHKRVNLDVAIVVDTYNSIISETIQAQHAALMAMSTPVAQLWEGILMLPLVGIIDSKRAQDVMVAVLNKVSDTQAKVFILDISGIAVMDTAVANHLIKITKAAKLMGCQCIVSGISPNVAQTIVELGIQTDEVKTHGSMRDALVEAFRLMSNSVKKEINLNI